MTQGSQERLPPLCLPLPNEVRLRRTLMDILIQNVFSSKSHTVRLVANKSSADLCGEPAGNGSDN
jgi:hypothetical protein